MVESEQNIPYIEYVLTVFSLSLQTKADSFYNKESFLQEIFQNVLRTGSNLMANQTLPAWRDLSRSRRIKVASNLIQTLDEHAFLLLSVLDQPEVIQESTNEIGNDLIRFKVHYEVIRLYLLNFYLLKNVY